VAIREAAVGGEEGAHGALLPVPGAHPGDGGGDLLAVGADVLDGCGADGSGDPREGLDPDHLARDGVTHRAVPVHAGEVLDDGTAAGGVQRGELGRVDGDAVRLPGGADLAGGVQQRRLLRVPQQHDRPAEGGVGGDEVGPAAQHEQRLAGVVRRGHGLDDLVGGAGLDELLDLAADAQRGQVGEPHAASGRARVARARPSTLAPSTSAVRSTRAVRPSSSIAPTTATTSRVTLPVAGTGTGLVKRVVYPRTAAGSGRASSRRVIAAPMVSMPWAPGLGGDGGVVVGGVEVAGGAGVAQRGVARDLVAGAGELLADGQRGQVRGGGGGGHGCSWVRGVCGRGAGRWAVGLGRRGQSPRTTSMLRTAATSAPLSSVRSTRVVIMEWPPAARTDSTVRVGTSRSPATTGRCRVKVSSPWTTREKSIPAAGSSMYCASVA